MSSNSSRINPNSDIHSDLNIIYWNACGITNKYTEFIHFLNVNMTHVALVCETWLKPKNKL